MSISLVPFTAADIPTLVSWIPDSNMLLQWAGPTLTWPLTPAQLEKDLANAGTASQFYRAHDAEDRTVGHIAIKAIDPIHSNAMLGRILIAPNYRGKGLAVPMVQSALQICFDDLKLHRVGLRVFAQNTSAIAAYKRAGFVAEGLDREVRRTLDGDWWNAVTMGILESEWLDQKGWALRPAT